MLIKQFSLLFIFLLLINCKTNYTKTQKHVNIVWDNKELNEGIIHKSILKQELFNSKQTINVLEIDLRIMNLKPIVVFDGKKFIKPSTWGSKLNGMFAINGNFFDIDNGGSVCYFKRNDTLINNSKPDPEELLFLPMLDEGAIAIDANESLHILKKPMAGWETVKNYNTILSSGPLLIWQGNILEQDNIPFITDRHARSALGISKNKLFLFVVDGYRQEASGMTIRELSLMMKSLGCNAAINLDGGGSSTLWVNVGESKGVLNYPSDNEIFDHEGERKVANSLVFTENN